MSESDFGDILKQWESSRRRRNSSRGEERSTAGTEGAGGAENAERTRARAAMEAYLAANPPQPESEYESPQGEDGGARLSPKRLPIEARLDLHGLTREEAERRTDAFIRQAAKTGRRKVLVIYGKGLHSREGGVLRGAIHRLLQDHPLTGSMGTPGRREGGTGAVWVVVRQRSR